LGLAARSLHGVRTGIIIASGDDGVAAAAHDDNSRAGEAERAAGIDRACRDDEREAIRHIAPLHELLGRGYVGDRRCKRGGGNQYVPYADHGTPRLEKEARRCH
jgi:hypothetical protein